MSGIELVPGDRFPHGTRARYVGGRCRCDDCRKANREYAKSRAHAEPNGLMNSDEARSHLALLARNGVGLRTVADVARTGRSVLQRITRGKQVRADVVRRVLQVTPEVAADHAIVPAGPTWAAIGEMLKRGLTRGEIALRLGRETPALQLRRSRVTRRTEHEVLKLLAAVRAEEAAPEVCDRCGESHAPERRRAWLARIAPEDIDLEVIREERACWYPRTDAGERKLHRDLAIVRARRAA